MLSSTVKILIADDDKDDHLFFKDAINELQLPVQLNTVNDGDQLMQYLLNASSSLPDLLFLDLNMPRKNGAECLTEIKNNPLLNKFPVIIFSTSYDEEKANMLYETGADYFICKPVDFSELKKVIHHALLLVQKNKVRPSMQNFLITKLKTAL